MKFIEDGTEHEVEYQDGDEWKPVGTVGRAMEIVRDGGYIKPGFAEIAHEVEDSYRRWERGAANKPYWDTLDWDKQPARLISAPIADKLTGKDET